MARERTLAKSFSDTEDTKCPCACRRTKLSGWGVHSEKAKEGGGVSQRRSGDR